MEDVLFRTKDISKEYPGTVALKGIDLEVRRGEIVGLVGENGAGKSTLLRIISCVEQSTSGSMEMRGEQFRGRNLLDANLKGVGMVFQEQSLMKNLSVAQNIYLGRERSFRRLGFIDWRRMNEAGAKVLDSLGLKDISPASKVGELDFATRQMVEIAKVLNIVGDSKDGCLILLDEPTSVLNDSEIKKLFEKVKMITRQGNSVIFVSHRLSEVIDISDRIYVFKDGRQTALVDKKDANEDLLYEKMVGRSTSGEYFKVSSQTEPGDDVVLEVRNLGLKGYFKDVSFRLRKKEVLGICGVVGSGKEEVCSVLCGDDRPDEGQIIIDGEECRFSDPSAALKSGVLSVPKERREEGIIGSMSVAENISLSSMDAISHHRVISGRARMDRAKDWILKLNIKTPGPKKSVETLSGGNAQKVVFARVISGQNKVVILNHPTRGVDVGAKEEIYQLIREITERGIGIVLLGDTLDETISLSSRVIVMKDGFVVAEMESPKDNKPAQFDIVRYMM
ncbi:MAG: sugar ABC transporter ATP-binding protein [Rectinemataceae bacterium]